MFLIQSYCSSPSAHALWSRSDAQRTAWHFLRIRPTHNFLYNPFLWTRGIWILGLYLLLNGCGWDFPLLVHYLRQSLLQELHGSVARHKHIPTCSLSAQDQYGYDGTAWSLYSALWQIKAWSVSDHTAIINRLLQYLLRHSFENSSKTSKNDTS